MENAMEFAPDPSGESISAGQLLVTEFPQVPLPTAIPPPPSIIDPGATDQVGFLPDNAVSSQPLSPTPSGQGSQRLRRSALVVWNKDRKRWLKDNQRLRNPERDFTFFRIKVPDLDEVRRLREEGAREARSHSDSISNLTKSQTIRKGRRVQALKNVDYKKFLQCYIHVQELKNFKVDDLIAKSETIPSNGSCFAKRKRGKGEQSLRSRKAAKSMKMVGAEADKGQPGAQLNCQQFSNNPTLELVQQFDTQNLMGNMGIDPNNPEHVFTVDLGGIDDVANFEQVDQVDLVDSFQVTSTPPRRSEYGSLVLDEAGKPRCTYTDLIEQALSESGGLTVSEIYQWISDHYPFFRPDDDRWKNSVRHNLSINPYFKKGSKARSGAGHLWTISEESRALRPSSRKSDLDIEGLNMSIENDTDRAVANILGQYHIAKNNLEGKGQTPADKSDKTRNRNATHNETSDTLCTPPISLCGDNSFLDHSFSEGEKLLESANSVLIQYENNAYPSPAEYTIDLSQLQFPDASGLTFNDLMPGGNVILIQTNDQDSNKENVNITLEHHSPDNGGSNSDYTMTVLGQDSQITETERVSGQLISEALTHEFDNPKDKVDMMSHGMTGHIGGESVPHERQELNTEHQMSHHPDETHYLTLDSIDHLALQEVINGGTEDDNCGSSGLHQFQLIGSSNMYDASKDIQGYCNFNQGIAP